MKKSGLKFRVPGAVVLLGLTVLATFAMYFAGGIASFFGANIFGIAQHAPFDGTVMPVKKIPNWVKLPAEIKNAQYSSIPASDLIDIPKYDPAVLATDINTLKWGDAAADEKRNAIITYSVPYLGNYKLDGKEFVGSHPAVDIKIPYSTPVFAIANGTVIKASTQSGGFGHHVVIQHNNFPSLADPNKKETLYSSYSHLGSVLISKGMVVTKGDQIGLSGKTGTATVPHLHFQIDNDEAPYHPFWPFTWSEAKAAGLDFFGAINAGLGLDRAVATSVHPMQYVQKYFNEAVTPTASVEPTIEPEAASSSSYIPTDVDLTTDPVADEVVEPAAEEPVVVAATPEPKEEEPIVSFAFSFDVKKEYALDGATDFTVLVKDGAGLPYNGGFVGDVVITSFEGNFSSADSIATSTQFDKNGALRSSLKNMKVGKDRLKLVHDGKSYFSDWFDIVSNSEVSFTDVSADNKFKDAITYLVKQGVVSGYPDGSFKPDKTVSRVEALKFIYEGIKASVAPGKLPFTDTADSEWYAKYLYTAYKEGVAGGYEDGTFKPTNTVNTAEFYKLLFAGMKVKVDENVTQKPFDDVEVDQWFAPYMAYAKSLGVIDADVKLVHPSRGMSRGEVAYAIFKLMETMK